MELLDNFLPLVFGILFLFAISILGAFFRRPTPAIGYQQRDALFSAAEVKFYKVLKEAVGDNCLIFGKVRVADVLKPEKGLNRSRWQSAFNRIAMKHFDFVML